jgi:hypothetical protein
MKDWLLRTISDKGRIPFKSVVNKTWGLLLNLWSSSINRRFPALPSNIRGLTFVNFFSRSTCRRLLNASICYLILLLGILPLVKDVLATLCSCRCRLSCHIIILIRWHIAKSYFWGCLFLQLLPRHQIWSQLLQTQIRRLRIKVLQSDGSVSYAGRVASSLRLRMILRLLAISERAQEIRL